ncbi:unnamed protein product [Rhizoctonia solani]|uniref:Uncharacterized protein n=1 Tax=Rhizoctonia solani TaxID=456999 RepID=A0A8H3D6V8_9AGAM|nr:unnamed protein product [Rhizoctonia solani]
MCTSSENCRTMTLEVAPSSSRGHGDSLVAESPLPSDRRELVAFIKRAVQDGDILPNAPNLAPARRRALIIAPQYREPGQTLFKPLPSTAVDFGLATIAEIFAFSATFVVLMVELTQPGRILLEWLVTGVTEGDYRFLHFSGHGDRVETDSSKGKEGRIVQSGGWLSIPGAWDSELSPDATKAGRVIEQTIARSELVYYNEAIITRISEESDLELGNEEEPGSVGKVWDRELNAYLSKLPKGCTITCIMDCCASGRILNLSKKLQGSGFRGKQNQATTSNPPPLLIPSVSNQDDAFTPTSPGILPPTISSISIIASTMVKYAPRMVRYARIVMQEGIPERERNMDKIQARVYAWSGCHQRQSAWDSNDCSSGIFTQAFTETCTRLGGTVDLPTRYTYNTRFEEVSKLVTERRTASKEPEAQFVQVGNLFRYKNVPFQIPGAGQLWTSSRDENRIIETQTSLLDTCVEF